MPISQLSILIRAKDNIFIFIVQFLLAIIMISFFSTLLAIFIILIIWPSMQLLLIIIFVFAVELVLSSARLTAF